MDKVCELRLRKSKRIRCKWYTTDKVTRAYPISWPIIMVNFLTSTDDGKRKQNFRRRGTQPTSSQNFWPNPLLSTTEAECVALSTAMRDVICFINLIQEIQDFGIKLPHTSKPKVTCRVFEDNVGALELANTHKLRLHTILANECRFEFGIMQKMHGEFGCKGTSQFKWKNTESWGELQNEAL